MRQPGTAAGPKGKHRIKFPIHPFHAGKAKQRRQRKRPRLRIGKRQGKPLRFRPVQRPAPRQPPGPAGVPPFAGPAPPPSASPPGDADRRASPRKRPAPPGRLLAARPPAAAARPERGCALASAGRPPAGRCPAGPGLPSRRGNLYRAPFRPRAALPRTAPGRRSPRRSASPVRRPVKTAPHKRPPSPPFPSILCGAGGEMRCKTVDRSADACYTVCDLKTIGAGKMRK